MSRRYLGGFITANPTIPTVSSASGAWTLSQQNQYANVWPFGGPFNYIEDVFSTYLYTGNGTSQTITNGIDLAGKGGMVWIKVRTNSYNHILGNTVLGTGEFVSSNTNLGATFSNQDITSYNSNGFSVGTNGRVNQNNDLGNGTFASWTFRKAPKFFDVVTWTGTGPVNHNLQAVPGLVIYKATSTTGNWNTIARQSDGSYVALYLNSTGASLGTSANASTAGLTATTFNPQAFIGASAGVTYVAYLFAHNAGGFGTSNNENVISCGSFTTDGSGNATVNLGYEPQWVLYKNINDAGTSWQIVDNMRGMSLTDNARLFPNSSSSELTGTVVVAPNATGFTFTQTASKTYIYMAIRRGPMATPTLGTSVFNSITRAGNGVNTTVTGTNFPPDLLFTKYRGSNAPAAFDRLRGPNNWIQITNTNGENTSFSDTVTSFNMDGISVGSDSSLGLVNFNYGTGINFIYWLFRRAPGFFDIVCYTGTGSARTVAHNLGVPPELMIMKSRNNADYWIVYSATLGNTGFVALNANNGNVGPNVNIWNSTNPTSTQFSLGLASGISSNESGYTYVAYLFASVAGVSKVGTYTGTGTTQTINCGFTAGARFVLIKRTDSTGDWFVWDTVRGMVAGTDPRLALNDNSAETNQNWVYTESTGFQIVTNNVGVNASGGTYIYLAIA